MYYKDNIFATMKAAIIVGLIGFTLNGWYIWVTDSPPPFSIHSSCLPITGTQVVKNFGHLNHDVCYVVTHGPDKEINLHTIQCVDTLEFQNGKRDQ